jgi:hypothetical protein
MTHTTTLAKMAKLIACVCVLSTTVLWGTRLTYKGKYISVDTSSPTAGSHVLLTGRLQEATNFTVKNMPIKIKPAIWSSAESPQLVERTDDGYSEHKILFNNQFLAWVEGTLQMSPKEDTTTIWCRCYGCPRNDWHKYWNIKDPTRKVVDKATDCELVVVEEV